MEFRAAYGEMLKGKKIKRPCFEGYWYIDGYTGKFMIHCRDGKVLTEGDLGHTLINSLATDWEVIK